MLRALVLQNYRSFGGADPLTLELRPLTLLFGRNNEGKSSITRALPLLADSMGEERLDALNLEDRLAPFELDFDSLRFKGRSDSDEPGILLGLEWRDTEPDRNTVLHWRVRHEDSWRRNVVDHLHVQAENRSLDARWRMTKGEEDQQSLTYEVTADHATTRAALRMRGLLPSIPNGPEQATVARASEMAASFARNVIWLRSLRPPPERQTRWKGGVRFSLEPDGRDAPVVLAAHPEVAREVSSFYATTFGYDLVLDETARREVRTLLRGRRRVGYDMDLIDCGEGPGQSLSVLTAFAMATLADRDGPSIVAIEEPEAHLHPDAQTALAAFACRTITRSPEGTMFLLETHSEYLLLQLRLEIVTGTISPDDVVLYWISQDETGRSTARMVTIDKRGRFVGDWPPTAFQEDIELALKIQDALGVGLPE